MAIAIITLTTDFGLNDPYVGQMKGAMLRRNPQLQLIDLSHGIAAQDILGAAMTLATSYHYFPQGTVHLAVVDPGVGSERAILAARGQGHLFVAPDNGILAPLITVGVLERIHCLEQISAPHPSATFHGRDLMGPLAADLAAGQPLKAIGPQRPGSACVQLAVPEVTPLADGFRGCVLQIDHFGNLRTSLTTHHLEQLDSGHPVSIQVGTQTVEGLVRTYSDRPSGHLLALIDSGGFLEVAVNEGNAAKHLGCKPHDPVYVRDPMVRTPIS